jgi:sphinganine-1-phosphate aldolase
MLKTRAAGDLSFADGQSPLSGAVYIGTAAHTKLLNSAYEMYATANPLHTDVWPSLRQMEAEVVSMTGAMLGGGPGTGVCGAMTSGGTESILMAMKVWTSTCVSILHDHVCWMPLMARL